MRRKAQARNPWPSALAACRIRGKKEALLLVFLLREWPKGQARRWLWIPGSPLRVTPE
jgi:hypothetical protein